MKSVGELHSGCGGILQRGQRAEDGGWDREELATDTHGLTQTRAEDERR